MAEQTGTPGATPVTDHRPVPRGVVPRGFQTWLMVGLAAGIVLIIVLTGEPEPPANEMPAATTPAAPNPDRLRDYQQRLRAMEARQALEAAAVPPAAPLDPRYEEPAGPRSRRSHCRRAEAPRVRKPLRQQRRVEPTA